MAEDTFREVEKETANQIADIYMNQLKRTKEYRMKDIIGISQKKMWKKLANVKQ